jgi:SOS response regulatory protein OraA/RecX
MGLKLEVHKENPKRILVFWEGELWRDLNKALFFTELKKFPALLSWEDFSERFGILEQKAGKRYAIYLLSRRALLSSALEGKLTEAGIALEVAEALVEFCRERGFLDDAGEIARLVAKEQKKGMSAKAIFFKLRAKKGIDQTLLREQLQGVVSQDEAALQRWLLKWEKKIDYSNPLEVRKWMAKLCRKGFSHGIVSRVFLLKLRRENCIPPP